LIAILFMKWKNYIATQSSSGFRIIEAFISTLKTRVTDLILSEHNATLLQLKNVEA